MSKASTVAAASAEAHGKSAINLNLELAPGANVLMRHAVSKGGNDYWAVLDKKNDGTRYNNPRGIGVPALGTTLPSAVTLSNPGTGESLSFPLAAGVTLDGREKVSAKKKVTLPNGAERMLAVSVSKRKDGGWQIKASAIGVSGGTGAPLRDLSDL